MPGDSEGFVDIDEYNGDGKSVCSSSDTDKVMTLMRSPGLYPALPTLLAVTENQGFASENKKNRI